METVAVAAVATAGIKLLVKKAADGLMKQYSMVFQNLKGDLKKLQKTLEMIEGYLRDLDNKSITQNAVKVWLRELENMAFDADNVLDKLNYHLLHEKTNKMINAISFSFFRKRKMALSIKKINSDFKFMSEKAAAFGIQYMVANALPAANDTSLETDSVSHVPVFIGRDNDVPELVNMLTQTHPEEEKQKFSIVALVGMGGMGKTTLTKKVFNHERVKSRFRSLLWVHVSQKF
ncbi:probable disease resistance protein RXW24L [Salvia hispanica]|uniref:probable disease resistance protein RXW24L n=1 Tax=Salvia hispanica TaxID=49212 RepID=UPI0020092F7C|nr:probable disease resistance protein RXW24L [Salvia hispanica]